MVIASLIQQRASNQLPPLSFNLTNNACSDRKIHSSTINGGKIPIFSHHLNVSSFVKLPFSGNTKKIKSFPFPATSIFTSSSDEHDEDNGEKNSFFNQNLYISSSVKLPFSGNIKNISKSFSNSSSSLICNHHLCISSFVKLPFSGKIKKIKSFSVPAASVSNTSSIEHNEDNGDDNKQPEIKNDQDLQSIFRRLWKVAAPYWSSDDKVQARLQLAAVFALTLGTTGISVGFNFLGRDFYNALSNKDQEQFTRQLLYYLGAFAAGIPVFVLRDYARETLSLRWRSWMTTFYMKRYLKNQTFYKIQSQSIIDNPDQRIVDDLSSFTGTALSFSLILFNAAVDLVSFSNILYGIYPPLFVVLIAYSVGGTAISIYLGRGLVMLNFFQEKKEADFRYGLVRVRENAESIAFYGGEKNEIQLLLQRFRSAVENLTELLIASRNLEFFTNGYRYLIQILPAAVIAPMYFSGKIEFGVINQSVSAFNHILGDISLIVYQFQSISAFSAVINRLGEFDEVLDRSNSENYDDSKERIQLQYCSASMSTNLEVNGSTTPEGSAKLLEIEELTLQTPTNQATLIKDLSIQIYKKDHLLISGPSGSGKTSLLRALAGLWSSGKGKVTFYESTVLEEVAQLEKLGIDCEVQRENKYRGVLFLPQKPYMTLGSLRQQLLYPIWTEDSVLASDNVKETGSLAFLMQTPDINGRKVSQKPTTEQLMQVLEDVRLGYILERIKSLNLIYEWSSVLSLGEQQRLAFARLLLSKPSLVLLDESTSALDEANEAHLYQRIEDAGITYISVGHRNTLYKYHKKVLRISAEDAVSATHNWYVEPINQESTYSRSRQ